MDEQDKFWTVIGDGAAELSTEEIRQVIDNWTDRRPEDRGDRPEHALFDLVRMAVADLASMPISGGARFRTRKEAADHAKELAVEYPRTRFFVAEVDCYAIFQPAEIKILGVPF